MISAVFLDIIMQTLPEDNTSNDFTRSTIISEHPFSPGILIACFEIIERLPVIMNESEEKSKYNKLNRLEQ